MRLNKPIVAVLLACFIGVMLFALTACNDDDFRNERNGEPEAGQFYTLQQAYDNGWLSKGDLRNIAYYFNGDVQKKDFKPTPKDPAELSPETILAIKECEARDLREAGFAEAVADDVKVDAYYGTYDGLSAIIIDSKYYRWFFAEFEEIIDGVKFIYHCSNKIRLWCIN